MDKKLKIALITLVVFIALAIVTFYITIARPFEVEDTLEGELTNSTLEAEANANQQLNFEFAGTEEAVGWGPTIHGIIPGNLISIATGFCEGECPDDAIILGRIMDFRQSTKQECEQEWGFDPAIVIDGTRYCGFNISEQRCPSVGGYPFYNAEGEYITCTLNEY